jgi:hypothetical protein
LPPPPPPLAWCVRALFLADDDGRLTSPPPPPPPLVRLKLGAGDERAFSLPPPPPPPPLPLITGLVKVVTADFAVVDFLGEEKNDGDDEEEGWEKRGVDPSTSLSDRERRPPLPPPPPPPPPPLPSLVNSRLRLILAANSTRVGGSSAWRERPPTTLVVELLLGWQQQ